MTRPVVAAMMGAAALAVLLGVAVPVAAAEPDAPDAPIALSPARMAEQAARERWQRAREQRATVRRADDAAQRQADLARQVGAQWQDAQEADVALARALQDAQDCLGEAGASVESLEAALQAADVARAKADAAADAVVHASGARLRPALSGAEQATQARRAAERDLRQALAGLQTRLSSCRSQVWRAQGTAETQRRRLDALAALASALIDAGADTAVRLDAVAALPVQPDMPLPPLVRPERSGDAALRRLAEALPPGPPPAATADASVLDRLRQLASERVRLQGTLATQTDAYAMLALLARTPASGCPRGRCPSFRADLAELSQRLTRTRAAWTSLRADQAQVQARLGGLLAAEHAEAATLKTVLQRAQPWVEPAGAEVLADSRRTQDALAPVLEAADQAEREAQQAWRLAAAQAGMPPPRAAGAAPPAPAMAYPAPAPAPAPDVRSHALAVFQSIGDEPPNFGAYTYVLVSGFDAKRNDEVAKRFRQLLVALRKNTEGASGVPLAERKTVNVFCVPTRAQERAAPEQMLIDYVDDLGLALMRRAQGGVLSKAMAARLASSPGPFLLTLPSRIDESGPNTALLLADLSPYDEADIADLVASYKKGLVDAFPEHQAEWKPNLPLTVGMTMVRWFSAPGRIVASAIAPANAKSRP
ncbi:hypothetical protein KAK06_02565 [Ideonella sp. 4Y11]|uniref:Uncharacterized protein n=1 Tax=Ideonella aquatica TaxID=2824119 RepID=A0A940YGN5_9BURK|nr:hypothetical protein [Ideonella aquatica]MBQ0957831.1 hypothetical protein [Ideonella aquatica]